MRGPSSAELLAIPSRQTNIDSILLEIRDCPFVNESFLETANSNGRLSFSGYDFPLPRMSEGELIELERVLERS
ncbi:hypothetical protein F5Y03DRAFT_352231 [Xylaria venustula]|nr:hypothetical protein F5Y03DRAFT_352231 [Xylaria venustula]